MIAWKSQANVLSSHNEKMNDAYTLLQNIGALILFLPKMIGIVFSP